MANENTPINEPEETASPTKDRFSLDPLSAKKIGKGAGVSFTGATIVSSLSELHVIPQDLGASTLLLLGSLASVFVNVIYKWVSKYE